jgi:hypothetical protein
MRRRQVLLAGLAMAGCAALPQAPECGTPGGAHIWLLDAGWHTEIGLPPAALPPHLTEAFPGAALVFFGFGKRHFMLAEAPGPAEWLAGPLPGEAAIQVTAWPGTPSGALQLGVSPQGLARLAMALEASFVPGPALIEARLGRRFYAAARGYSLAYTCNTWTAEMLAAAGLAVRPDAVVLARGVTAQAAALPGACRMPARPRLS